MQSNEVVRQQMFALIDKWRQGGLPQKVFCEQHDIPYHVFHYWYKRYRKQNAPAPSFIQLNVPSSDSVVQAELICGDGKRLVFHQPVSAEYLRALLA